MHGYSVAVLRFAHGWGAWTRVAGQMGGGGEALWDEAAGHSAERWIRGACGRARRERGGRNEGLHDGGG